MTTFSESNSEHPTKSPQDEEEAAIRRRAECAEKISRLLSALDGGTSPGKTAYLTKKVIRKVKSNSDSDTSTRFLLIDRNGPIGEFGSWEDACQYRNDLHHHSASIISAEQKSLEPSAVQEQPTNKAVTQPAAKPAAKPAAEPVNLAANPVAAQPALPETAQPTKPVAAQPTKPETAQLTKPETAQLTKPVAAQPTKPETAQPTKPETVQLTKPETAQSPQPVATQPTKQVATQPAGITGAFDSPNRSVIQELKKPDVPCDSRPDSVPKNNALPANPTVMRIVGKIFPAAAKTATLNACAQILTHHYELLVLGNFDAQITNVVGVGNLTLTCAPPAPNYGTINIHYTTEQTKSPNHA